MSEISRAATDEQPTIAERAEARRPGGAGGDRGDWTPIAQVGIIMGSKNDMDKMLPAEKYLNEQGIPTRSG